MTAVGWHLNVLIPARNEADLLPRCLHSVMAAREYLLSTAPRVVASCDVIVAVDCSEDATFEIAQRILGKAGIAVRCDEGIVGAARAEAARTAFRRRQKHSPSHLWLANTDADCVVPTAWLTDQLELAEAGAHAVAGIVEVDSFAEHDAVVQERFQSTYLLHPDGTHPHIHGANLGVRADAYLLAGGWANLCTAEDHDLWNRLKAVGARTVSTAKVKVVTSGRRIGRAPMGFADALAAHNEVAA